MRVPVGTPHDMGIIWDFYFAFNQNGYFVIRDHITIIYDMGIIRMHFSIQIQIYQSLWGVKTYYNTLYDWSIIQVPGYSNILYTDRIIEC